MYKVVFYTPKRKKSPISEFLDNCKVSLRAKIIRQLKYVQEFGLTPAVPNLRKLKGTPLWELRILGKDNVRIICAKIRNRQIVILHIFRKKKQKTPTRELNIALGRYKDLTDDIL